MRTDFWLRASAHKFRLNRRRVMKWDQLWKVILTTANFFFFFRKRDINCYLLNSQRKLGAGVGSEVLPDFVLIGVKSGLPERVFQNGCEFSASRGWMYLQLGWGQVQNAVWQLQFDPHHQQPPVWAEQALLTFLAPWLCLHLHFLMWALAVLAPVLRWDGSSYQAVQLSSAAWLDCIWDLNQASGGEIGVFLFSELKDDSWGEGTRGQK